MAKKKAKHKGNTDWETAQKRCRLSAEEVAMAKELGFGSKSLLKNIPSPSERWKLPVKDWIRECYAKKFGNRCPTMPTTKAKPTPHPPVPQTLSPSDSTEASKPLDEVPFLETVPKVG